MLAVAIVALLAAVLPAHFVTASTSLGLHLAPCTQGRSNVPAECGTFGVYENRTARSGRIIALRVVVVKAKHPSNRAIALIAGGPGESAVSEAPPFADGDDPAIAALMRDYDLVFVDARGMGDSNPFTCDFSPIGDPAAYFRALFPDSLISQCRQTSLRTHDLRLYNTNNAVDDLNDVRAALGYRKLVLDGGSYGTFTSFIFMRRHPGQVESAVLDSVAAPHFLPLPGSPEGAQTALDDLITKCVRNVPCNQRFPAFGSHVQALLRRFDDGPVQVNVRNARTGQMQTVALSKEVFVDNLRHVLYWPPQAAYIPYIVERAYRGDYVPLGTMIQSTTQGLAEDVNAGSNLAYTCREWIPFISARAVREQASRSFAGDLRIRAQQHACAIWNTPPMPASFNEPVRSNAPVLMISASDDPATPASYATRALRYLPNGKQVIVRGAGHSSESACTDRLIVQFVRANSARGLDVDQCTTAFTLPSFATSMAGWQ
jgi:pimeloyl-ACP methyl ester carboxylesterase